MLETPFAISYQGHCQTTPNYLQLGIQIGLDNLRASEPCEADVRGTQVSLKNTPVSLKNTPVSLNSTQVSLNSSPVSLTISIYVGGCSCLACFVHDSHVCLTCLARLPRMPHMPRWLAYCPHSTQIIMQVLLGL